MNPRRRFNRSLTEVRPDAYIFDDGHLEVLTVPEESELLKSQEALNEISMDRKHSIQSEDSDMLGSTQKTVQDHPRRPNITIRQETTSTESPLEISDDQTLVGDGSAEDIVDMNFEGKLNYSRSSRTLEGLYCFDDNNLL